jgi:hypothetical protein
MAHSTWPYHASHRSAAAGRSWMVAKPETGCQPATLPTSRLRVAPASPKAAIVSLMARSWVHTGSAALRQALRAS